jgi:hypothetical protein
MILAMEEGRMRITNKVVNLKEEEATSGFFAPGHETRIKNQVASFN